MCQLSLPITESEPTLENDRVMDNLAITWLMKKGPYSPFSIRDIPPPKSGR